MLHNQSSKRDDPDTMARPFECAEAAPTFQRQQERSSRLDARFCDSRADEPILGRSRMAVKKEKMSDLSRVAMEVEEVKEVMVC